jgi:hypothetical protein
MKVAEFGSEGFVASSARRLTPIERVELLYETHDCVRTFGEDLRAHLANGIIICAPDFFAMGRAISREGTWEEIHDPWFRFPREVQDAWYIYVFAGRVNTCLQFIPFPLRWMAWERVGKNQLRFLDFNRFKKRCA